MSRSELHNWECAIEKLGGDNANQLLDIAQDIYNTGYVRGKNYMSYVIEDIKQEIEAIIGEHNLDDYDFCSGLIRARKIIDKRLKGEE